MAPLTASGQHEQRRDLNPDSGILDLESLLDLVNDRVRTADQYHLAQLKGIISAIVICTCIYSLLCLIIMLSLIPQSSRILGGSGNTSIISAGNTTILCV